MDQYFTTPIETVKGSWFNNQEAAKAAQAILVILGPDPSDLI